MSGSSPGERQYSLRSHKQRAPAYDPVSSSPREDTESSSSVNRNISPQGPIQQNGRARLASSSSKVLSKGSYSRSPESGFVLHPKPIVGVFAELLSPTSKTPISTRVQRDDYFQARRTRSRKSLAYERPLELESTTTTHRRSLRTQVRDTHAARDESFTVPRRKFSPQPLPTQTSISSPVALKSPPLPISPERLLEESPEVPSPRIPPNRQLEKEEDLSGPLESISAESKVLSVTIPAPERPDSGELIAEESIQGLSSSRDQADEQRLLPNYNDDPLDAQLIGVPHEMSEGARSWRKPKELTGGLRPRNSLLSDHSRSNGDANSLEDVEAGIKRRYANIHNKTNMKNKAFDLHSNRENAEYRTSKRQKLEEIVIDSPKTPNLTTFEDSVAVMIESMPSTAGIVHASSRLLSPVPQSVSSRNSYRRQIHRNGGVSEYRLVENTLRQARPKRRKSRSDGKKSSDLNYQQHTRPSNLETYLTNADRVASPNRVFKLMNGSEISNDPIEEVEHSAMKHQSPGRVKRKPSWILTRSTLNPPLQRHVQELSSRLDNSEQYQSEYINVDDADDDLTRNFAEETDIPAFGLKPPKHQPSFALGSSHGDIKPTEFTKRNTQKSTRNISQTMRNDQEFEVELLRNGSVQLGPAQRNTLFWAYDPEDRVMIPRSRSDVPSDEISQLKLRPSTINQLIYDSTDPSKIQLALSRNEGRRDCHFDISFFEQKAGADLLKFLGRLRTAKPRHRPMDAMDRMFRRREADRFNDWGGSKHHVKNVAEDVMLLKYTATQQGKEQKERLRNLSQTQSPYFAPHVTPGIDRTEISSNQIGRRARSGDEQSSQSKSAPVQGSLRVFKETRSRIARDHSPEKNDASSDELGFPSDDMVRATRSQVAVLTAEPLRPLKFSETVGLGVRWTRPLVYPAVGRDRATVDFDDLKRLDEGEWLNDNLIMFYLKYLENNTKKLSNDSVYIYNTFFYQQLTDVKGRQSINYLSVKKWTKIVDIFAYNFAIVPINQNAHWWLAIICNLPELDPQSEKRDSPEIVVDGPGIDNSLVDDYINNTELTADTSSLAQRLSNPHGSNGCVEDAISRLALQPSKEPDNGRICADVGLQLENELEKGIEDMNRDQLQRDGEDVFGEFASSNRSISSSSSGPGDSAVRSLSNVHNAQEKAVSSPLRKNKVLIPPVRKYDPRQPAIISLDSLGIPRSGNLRLLKQYLVEEAIDKRGVNVQVEDIQGMSAKQIPEQQTDCDCGIYLLIYMEKFMENPREFVNKLLRREMDVTKDWEGMNASEFRAKMRKEIIQLHEEQERLYESKKALNKDAKREKKRRLNADRIGISEPPLVEGTFSKSSPTRDQDSRAGEGHKVRAEDTPCQSPPCDIIASFSGVPFSGGMSAQRADSDTTSVQPRGNTVYEQSQHEQSSTPIVEDSFYVRTTLSPPHGPGQIEMESAKDDRIDAVPVTVTSQEEPDDDDDVVMMHEQKVQHLVKRRKRTFSSTTQHGSDRGHGDVPIKKSVQRGDNEALLGAFPGKRGVDRTLAQHKAAARVER